MRPVGQPHQCHYPAGCDDIDSDRDECWRLVSPDPNGGRGPLADKVTDCDDPPLDHREAGNRRSADCLRSRRDGRLSVLRR